MISPSWMTEDRDEEKAEEEKESIMSAESEGITPKKRKTQSLDSTANERTALNESIASDGDDDDDDDDDDDEIIVVRRGPILTFFVAISVLSVMAAIMLSVAHAASLYSFIVRRRDTQSRGAVDVALRAYGLIFCATICSIELQIGINSNISILSRFWSLRGLFYAFVGLLALDNADSDERRRDGDHHIPAAWREDGFMPYSLYLRCAAAALLILGSIYILLGLCWCHRCKETRSIEYRRKLAEAQVRKAELAQRRSEQNSNPLAILETAGGPTIENEANSGATKRRAPTGRRRPSSAKSSERSSNHIQASGLGVAQRDDFV